MSHAEKFIAEGRIFRSPLFQANWLKFVSGRERAYDLLKRFSEKFKLTKPDGSSKYEVKQANGLTFFTDPEKPKLEDGEMAVYPFFDEGEDLLRLVTRVVEEREKEGRGKLKVLVDPYSGGGHSGLPIIKKGLVEGAILGDINPRAIHLATANAELNGINDRTTVIERDILNDGLPDSDSPGNTLYIANPPFALTVEGYDEEVMRAGGPDGLTLTRSFASQAIEKAQPGDVIVGVAYSRIKADGTVELTAELEELTKKYGIKPEVSLMEGKNLWRGFNGKKEQPNPMPINEETFALKPDPANLKKVAAYKMAARFHNEQGYTRLGYFSYVIRK